MMTAKWCVVVGECVDRLSGDCLYSASESLLNLLLRTFNVSVAERAAYSQPGQLLKKTVSIDLANYLFRLYNKVRSQLRTPRALLMAVKTDMPDQAGRHGSPKHRLGRSAARTAPLPQPHHLYVPILPRDRATARPGLRRSPPGATGELRRLPPTLPQAPPQDPDPAASLQPARWPLP